MNELNVEEEVSKIAQKATERGVQYKHYLYCKNPQDANLLFVGLNPSEEKENDKNELSINPKNPTVTPQIPTGVKHPYFNKFRDISKKTGLQWGHLDLLYFRDTNQKNVYEIAQKKSDFIEDQLKLSLEQIKKMNPKIIVICNSLARDFLTEKFNQSGVSLKQSIEFDETLGTYRWEWNNTPIFFTSMLTGQRALDTGSYERLIWHIKFVNKLISVF